MTIEEMRKKLSEHCIEQAKYCFKRNIRNGCIFCVLRDNENPHCFHHVTDEELTENYNKVFNQVTVLKDDDNGIT